MISEWIFAICFLYVVLSMLPGLVLAVAQRDSRWIEFSAAVGLSAAMDCIGFVLLIPLCLFKLWVPAMSTEWAPDAVIKAHMINVWRWDALNEIWGNPEDGVTGSATYLSGWPDQIRAYVWSGWRNRSDNLKYVFARPGGPFYLKNFSSWYVMAGYRNAAGTVCLSAGRGNL